ncbi:alpha/beta hydrolase [Labrys neptuniae]|uniref:alpha/beta hydrolase n=1 Tax=Labrys neptuniae TaxID=376174 RepID=UPI00288D79CA|nr:alpha/beta hydrolase [Labrys neptuniae]MDT3382042.1 alpha/beta hydrolase [Labrys neptuniae]
MSNPAIGAIGGALPSSRPDSSVALSHQVSFDAALDEARTSVSKTSAPKKTFAYANTPIHQRPISEPEPDHTTVLPEGSDPSVVSSWWGTLSTETRQDLIANHTGELGKLRGLPAEDIDKINRKRVNLDIARDQERLWEIPNEIQALKNAMPSGKAGRDGVNYQEKIRALKDEQSRLRGELSIAKKIHIQMEMLDSQGGSEAYLLTYDPADDGRFAVALGNPDTAHNIGVLVPGVSHDAKKEDGIGSQFPTVTQGLSLFHQMNFEGQPNAKNSIIVWMGADMPDNIPAGINGTYGDSRHGAQALKEDVTGYEVARTNPHSHITLIGHSYGSYMASVAIHENGLRVDDLVVVGSPGVDGTNATELGSQGHVWAARAKGDDVVPQGWLADSEPTDRNFGAITFSAEGAEGHGAYLDNGTQSLVNIARIATGKTGDVVTRVPDEYGTIFFKDNADTTRQLKTSQVFQVLK